MDAWVQKTTFKPLHFCLSVVSVTLFVQGWSLAAAQEMRAELLCEGELVFYESDQKGRTNSVLVDVGDAWIKVDGVPLISGDLPISGSTGSMVNSKSRAHQIYLDRYSGELAAISTDPETGDAIVGFFGDCKKRPQPLF